MAQVKQQSFSEYDTQKLWQQDKDHFVHPWHFFDAFKEDGALIIAEGEGCYIWGKGQS